MEYYIAWLIVLAPLSVSPIILALGKRMKDGGAYLAIFSVLVSLISSVYALYYVIKQGSIVLEGFVAIPSFKALGGEIKGFSWSLYLDNLSVTTAIIVAIVSLLIFIFSIEYMRGDPGIARYFAEISFFVGSMQGLVLANNLIMLYLFWEFVGLASYLLIGFWQEREEVAKAARKAFIVTRIGDVFFLSGIIILWIGLGYLPTIQEIQSGSINNSLISLNLAALVPLLFFGGSIGKSAQFPLHVWLPDAMEGPTTVSALIHSATMVAAGVYLVARTYTIFAIDPLPLTVVGLIGAITSLYAGILGIASNDIKRVLAYSTISQLGLMMLALGLRIPSSSMMHLYAHAFSKALMFLGAGAIIHELGTRNMLEMGGLSSKMKASYYAMLIGGFSLIGVPPFSGFFTKEPILEDAIFNNPILFILGIASSFFTAIYWMRIIQLTYLGNPRSEAAMRAERESLVMRIPIYGFIALTSVFGVFAMLFNLPNFLKGEYAVLKLEFEALAINSSLILFTVSGAYLYYIYYNKNFLKNFTESNIGKMLRLILENGYYFDYVYERIAKYAGWIFGISAKFFDEKIIDGAVNGLGGLAKNFGHNLRKIQTGNLEQYLFYAFAFASIILIIAIFIMI